MGMPDNFAKWKLYDEDSPPPPGSKGKAYLAKRMDVGTADDIAALTGLTLEQLWQAIGDGQPVGDPPIIYTLGSAKMGLQREEEEFEMPVGGRMPEHAGGGLASDVTPPPGNTDFYEGRPVDEVDMGNHVIRSWNSVSDALDDLPMSRERLLEAIRGNLLVMGFRYRLGEAVQRDEDEEAERVEPPKVRVEVGYMPAPAIPAHLVDHGPTARAVSRFLGTKIRMPSRDLEKEASEWEYKKPVQLKIQARAGISPSAQVPKERKPMFTNKHSRRAQSIKVWPEGQPDKATIYRSLGAAAVATGASGSLIRRAIMEQIPVKVRRTGKSWVFENCEPGTETPAVVGVPKESKEVDTVLEAIKADAAGPAVPLLRGKPSDALVMDQAHGQVTAAPPGKSSLRVVFVELTGDDQTLAAAFKLLESTIGPKFAAPNTIMPNILRSM